MIGPSKYPAPSLPRRTNGAYADLQKRVTQELEWLYMMTLLIMFLYQNDPVWSLPPVCVQGMALHQKVTNERSGVPGQAQSFLAQQRQSTQARRGLSARLQPR